MNAKSLLLLLTALLIAPAAVPLLPTAPVRAQTTTESDAAALLEEGGRLYEQGLQQFNTSQFREAIASLEQALEIVRAVNNRQAEGNTLNALGAAYENLAQYERAIELYEEALAITREIDERRGEGNALGNLGNAYLRLGQYQEAIELYEQQLVIVREIGDRRGEGNALSNSGNAYLRLGQYQEAIELYEQRLVIAREIGDRHGEGAALNNLGLAYADLGQYQEAIELYQRWLVIAREISDRSGEGIALGNLANSYANLGQYQEAIELHEQRLVIAREIGDRSSEGSALGGLADSYADLGQYQEAIELYEQRLVIAREIGDRRGEGIALSNLGLAYRNLGQYQEAIELYQQQLVIAREIGDRRSENVTLGFLGIAYADLGQYQAAIELYQRQLMIAREIGNRREEASALVNFANAYVDLRQYETAIEFYQQGLVIAREIGDRRGEGLTLGNLGVASAALGQYQAALELYQQYLAIAREIGDRRGEGVTLGNLGVMHNSLGQPEQSLEQYQQALSIAQDIGDRANEGVWLSYMGSLLAAQNQPELAIVFYKQSVNVRESIRDNIQGLPQDQQQSFTDTIADDYRELADLLLQQNRILEAQEVLDLLKLQELQDYELRVRGTADTRLGLDFWEAEQAILDRFFTQLSINPQFDFNAFIASPDIVANVQQLQQNARGQNLNPAQLIRLQDNLQQAGNAALLYPLILDDRLELVLVTPDGLINETVPVDRLTLNAAIVGFRQDITDRFSDPRANAQQLYEWLMQPIIDDLEASGVDTILYAADGALRYIPIAALHDGNQWLTERFTINHITAASLTDFTQQGANDLNILAGAFPEQDVYVDLGTEQVWFSGLPFAQEEVQNLVSSIPQTTAFFSQDFNRTAIETRLGDNYTIIHLATHAEFRSGHPTDSFILLGDGDRLTVADLNRWQLPDVDLVVLSACKTAVSSELGDGAEILGFGYQMQQTGADAAIAFLWYVSDGGTQVLMDAFYTALDNGLSESEALRRSQQALITSDTSVLGGDRGNTATIEIVDPRTGELLSNSPDLAHPYYWAPFILIGNGL